MSHIGVVGPLHCISFYRACVSGDGDHDDDGVAILVVLNTRFLCQSHGGAIFRGRCFCNCAFSDPRSPRDAKAKKSSKEVLTDVKAKES